MRYIASQTENPLRLVGLSNSVANARDLGEWLGAPSNAIFAFHPNKRPVPLERRVQGFDISNFQARQLAMVKPTYLSIKHHSPAKPVLIFVSSRKAAREVAVDLMTFIDAEPEEGGQKFLHADIKELEPHLANVQNRTLKETLQVGIGFYHAGLSPLEKAVVQRLFGAGAIQVVISEYSLCWGMTMSSHMVVIMDTQVYDGREHRYVDCPIADICQMMGRASRPLLDKSAKCIIFCETSKKEYFKTLLSDPFPVESHLDQALADHLNAEIITKRIENEQDAVHYLTWSFFYRRLTQNPNYYNLQGVSHRHLSDHLSELVENTLEELETAKCITREEEEGDLSALNLGMIAAYYYIKYTTVELFSEGLKSKIKLNGLLEVLCSASEFEHIQVRHREDYALKRTAKHLPLQINNPGLYNEPHVKTNVLLQAHFSRIDLSAAAASDQQSIIPNASRLLQAMVDVISSNGWLLPALAAMELSQMVTQGMWNTDSPLLQLPHVTKRTVDQLNAADVKTVADVMDKEDEDRDRILN
jgi:pre-mRNA-splicing helicase BRR2